VLSVVAQQVHSILSALRERRKAFVFTDGTTLSLMPTCGIFITMNPGYAGRTELPESILIHYLNIFIFHFQKKEINKMAH
jgi:dynein heavy chain, axonemal